MESYIPKHLSTPLHTLDKDFVVVGTPMVSLMTLVGA